MKKFLSFILAAVMLLSMTACGGGSNQPAASGDGGSAEKQLVVGVVKANTNFNPYAAYGDEQYGQFQVFDTLVVRDKDGQLVPSAAEKYEISDDGLHYTFYLRKGVKFSNGAELNADIVEFCFKIGIESSITNWMFGNVENVEKIDDMTVRVTLSKPNLAFLEQLTYLFLVEKGAYEQHGEENFGKTIETTVGSGPYVVENWTPGETIDFKANENYWAGAPSIKKVKFKTITDTNAAVMALQNGEIGLYIHDVPDMAVPDIEKNDKLTLTKFSSYVFQDIIMNCERAPFDDVRVRQAVGYAVDRATMLNIGTEGTGTIVDYPGGPDYNGNPNIKVFMDYDVEKAKELVKEAGVEGITVNIKTMESEPWPKLATALQGQLAQIGINSTVEILEMNAYSQTIWQNFDYEIAISRFWSATKDQGELMDLIRPGNPMNFSQYTNEDIVPIFDAAAAERDPEKRKALYGEAAKVFMPDVPLVPLYYTRGTRAYSSELAIEEGNVQYDHIKYYSWK